MNKDTQEEKERYYIKDKSDGQEYCISGEKHFYLIDVTDTVKESRERARADERKKMVEKLKEISQNQWNTLSQIKREAKNIGLDYDETLEMAYENLSNEHKRVLRVIKNLKTKFTQ